MRSAEILARPNFCFNRAVYKSMGFSDGQLEQPIIGIANSWSELVPGSYNLRAVAQHVKNGIFAAGGTPVEFGITGPCDGTAQGNVGMHYILPSRDLIACDVEVMAQAHQLDALVLLGSCDKIVPGLLMAAARLGLPAILLPGGPMQGGPVFDGRKSDLTSLSEGCGMLSTGALSEEELYRLEDSCGPGCGSCSFYGTANTMCCLSEALGMSLPGAALIPAVYAERSRMAFATGQAIVSLARQNLTASSIITKGSLQNALRVLHATGGSTNGVLHLLAIAQEAGISAEWLTQQLEETEKTTPLLVKVNPASEYNMEDFYHAGGIPAVLRELRGLLDLSVPTVGGGSLGQALDALPPLQPDRRIIKTLENPFSHTGGIAVVRGNLAPEGGITKPSAIVPEMHHFVGHAVVFGCEEDAEEAILQGRVQAGAVVVIRYEGPKGGPGMREMFKAMKYLYGRGLATSTALITDGRFSGTNNGCFVGHISPEAAEGGPIALIQDGDRIEIDIPHGRIHLHVSKEELGRRKEAWRPPAPRFKSGYLGLYSKWAASASRGGVLEI